MCKTERGGLHYLHYKFKFHPLQSCLIFSQLKNIRVVFNISTLHHNTEVQLQRLRCLSYYQGACCAFDTEGVAAAEVANMGNTITISRVFLNVDRYPRYIQKSNLCFHGGVHRSNNLGLMSN